jgi:ankyrin repeat protein
MLKGNEIYYEGADYYVPHNIDDFVKAMIACQINDIEIVKSYKGDINDKVLWHSTKEYAYVPEQSLLSTACRYGNTEIVEYLLNIKARVDDQDEYGSTPLHYASTHGHLDVIKLLVMYGADVNKKACKQFVRLYKPGTDKQTGTFETPMHNACRLGHLHIVEYLLSVGGEESLNMKDHYGRIPKYYCEEGEWVDQTSNQKAIENFLNNYIVK